MNSNAKIKTVSEILQAIDSIGSSQTVAYNTLEGNNLMRCIIDQGANAINCPPELETIIKQHVAVITTSFAMWAASLDRLVQLRQAIITLNSESNSPATVAAQILADLAQDTEFDTH